MENQNEEATNGNNVNDETQTGDQQAPETDGAEGAEEKGFDLQSVDRKYYAPSDIKEGFESAKEIVAGLNELGIAAQYNFNPEEEFPEGYGLAIIPLSKRVPQQGNVNVNVCFAAIPDPETVAQADGGADWIYSTLTAALLAKVANNARPKADGSTAGSLPLSVNDFITSQRAGENLEAWKKYAPRYVQSLKQKGKGRRIRRLTVALLKQILQSAEFAESVYSKIPQTAWEKVLDSMIKNAKADGYDTSALEHWKETRDSAEMEEPTLDLDDLDDLS